MEDKKPKIGRTVKLEHNLNERLIALCAHLGVNPNAYLLNKIGEAVSRDEVSYLASTHVNGQQAAIEKLFAALMEDQTDK